MDCLTAAEQVLVMVFRKRLEGDQALAQVRTLLYLACGVSRVEVALASFEAMFNLLGRHARRVLGFHRPTCDGVSADERALLGLVAAHQAGRTVHAESLAQWLVPGSVAGVLSDQAAALAEALAQRARHLPVRDRLGRRRSNGSEPSADPVPAALCRSSH